MFGDEHQKTTAGKQINTMLLWNRDRHVQIGVAACELTGDPVVGGDSGFWMNLNRAQINDLIRYLRRARDHAYGRDE